MKTKKWMTIVAVMVGMLTAVGTQAANITAYLDVNGTSSGSGVTNGGSYSASSAIWTSDSTGAYATPVTLAGNRAAFYFSAGTDASNCSYVVTDALGDVTTGLTVQEGYVTLTGGGRFYGSSSISCAENTSLSFSTGAWSFYSQPVTFNTSTNSTIYCNVGISGGTAYNCSFSKTGDGLMVMNTSATAIGSIPPVSMVVNCGFRMEMCCSTPASRVQLRLPMAERWNCKTISRLPITLLP